MPFTKSLPVQLYVAYEFLDDVDFREKSLHIGSITMTKGIRILENYSSRRKRKERSKENSNSNHHIAKRSERITVQIKRER